MVVVRQHKTSDQTPSLLFDEGSRERKRLTTEELTAGRVAAAAANVVSAADACRDAVRVAALQHCGAVPCAAVAEIVSQRRAPGVGLLPYLDAVADGLRDLEGGLVSDAQQCAPNVQLGNFLRTGP